MSTIEKIQAVGIGGTEVEAVTDAMYEFSSIQQCEINQEIPDSLSSQTSVFLSPPTSDLGRININGLTKSFAGMNIEDSISYFSKVIQISFVIEVWCVQKGSAEYSILPGQSPQISHQWLFASRNR